MALPKQRVVAREGIHTKNPSSKEKRLYAQVNAIAISTDTYKPRHPGYTSTNPTSTAIFVNHPSGSLYSKSALTGATKWLSRKQRVVTREGIHPWPRETSGTCGMRFFAKQHEKIKFQSVPLPSRTSRYNGNRSKTRLPRTCPFANVP